MSKDGKKPDPNLHTFDLEESDTASQATPGGLGLTEENTAGMSAEDIDAIIRQKLEEGGGLLDLGLDFSATLSESPAARPRPAPASAAPSPKLNIGVAHSLDDLAHAHTGAMDTDELEKMAAPYAMTGSMESPNKSFPVGKGLAQTGAMDANELEKMAAPYAMTGSMESPNKSFPVGGKEPQMPPTLDIPQANGEADSVLRQMLENPTDFLPSGDDFSASPKPRETDELIGQVVVGRYELTDLLGKGGMGKVYRARQLGLKRDVAIKVLHPHLASEKESRLRFQREAQSMTRISHPGIATVFDFGEWSGKFFIAMEILEGQPLSQIITRYQGLPTETIVDLLGQVCEALAAAHSAGIVHRDLKPENIILLDGQRTKIVDFGLAVLKDPNEEERLTMDGMTIGTPHYMPPEQCQGMEVDARSDIYALGCILYEMLCGDIPFVGDSLMSIMMQQLFAVPLPPSQRTGGTQCDPLLEELALKALSKEPGDRPPDAMSFRHSMLQTQEDSASDASTDRAQKLASRDARASAVGLPRLSGRIVRAPTKFAEILFLILESPEHYSESLTMHMWSNGFTVKQIEDLPTLLTEIGELDPAGVIVDLRKQPQGFAQVKQALFDGAFGEAAVVVVGPDESFELMTQALECGVFDYAPDSQVKEKLPKSLKRLARRMARKKK